MPQKILKLSASSWDKYCPGISDIIYKNCTDKDNFANCCKNQCTDFKTSSDSECQSSSCDNCDDIPKSRSDRNENPVLDDLSVYCNCKSKSINKDFNSINSCCISKGISNTCSIWFEKDKYQNVCNDLSNNETIEDTIEDTIEEEDTSIEIKKEPVNKALGTACSYSPECSKGLACIKNICSKKNNFMLFIFIIVLVVCVILFLIWNKNKGLKKSTLFKFNTCGSGSSSGSSSGFGSSSGSSSSSII